MRKCFWLLISNNCAEKMTRTIKNFIKNECFKLCRTVLFPFEIYIRATTFMDLQIRFKRTILLTCSIYISTISSSMSYHTPSKTTTEYFNVIPLT